MSIQSGYNEKELFARIAEGDERAFRLLFNAYRPRIYNFAFAHSRSEMLADEITQEVFIKVWTGGHRLKEILMPDAWLKTITRNLVYSQLRRLKAERAAIANFTAHRPEESETTEQAIAANEVNRTLQKVLAQLTEQQRIIFRMSREENMSYAAIGAALGISDNTVNYHIKTILRHLRATFNDHLDLLFIVAMLSFYKLF